MNIDPHFPQNAQQRIQYTFKDEGWAIGDPPSFEEELAASDGNDDEDVANCIKAIEQLQTDNSEKLEKVKTYSPKLYRRIVREDPARLIPDFRSGMTAGSVRYVIKHLAERIDTPNNVEQQDSNFLKWVAQICITIWVYQCDRGVFEDLGKCARDFIFNTDFRPSENDAAYLAIIAFVLGGALDNKLAEYVDAVIWQSRTELGFAIAPLRRTINSERQSLLEFIFHRFSQVLNELGYSGNQPSRDQQLWSVGQRFHEHLKSSTESQLDLRRPFANSQQLDCARYPALFERTFLRALHAELKKLKARAPSFGSNHGDANGQTVRYPAPVRHGAGGAFLARVFKAHKQGPSHTPEALADRLERIIKESGELIAEQRSSKIANAVQELIGERDSRFDASSSTEDGSDLYTGSGSIGDIHDEQKIPMMGGFPPREIHGRFKSRGQPGAGTDSGVVYVPVHSQSQEAQS